MSGCSRQGSKKQVLQLGRAVQGTLSSHGEKPGREKTKKTFFLAFDNKPTAHVNQPMYIDVCRPGSKRQAQEERWEGSASLR